MVDLEFDHKFIRTWHNSDFWSNVKLSILEREAAQGKLQLLCGFHNRQKGKPEDNEPF